MKVNPVLSVEANYGETIREMVAELATSTPHIQAMQLVVRIFSVRLADVRHDCVETWTRARHAEINRESRRG